jgi:hypothetical protein
MLMMFGIVFLFAVGIANAAGAAYSIQTGNARDAGISGFCAGWSLMCSVLLFVDVLVH